MAGGCSCPRPLGNSQGSIPCGRNQALVPRWNQVFLPFHLSFQSLSSVGQIHSSHLCRNQQKTGAWVWLRVWSQHVQGPGFDPQRLETKTKKDNESFHKAFLSYVISRVWGARERSYQLSLSPPCTAENSHTKKCFCVKPLPLTSPQFLDTCFCESTGQFERSPCSSFFAPSFFCALPFYHRLCLFI